MIFDIIYTDFPFDFNKRDNPDTKFGRGVHDKYKTMTDQDIVDLKPLIDKITDKNSMILAWASGSLDHRNNQILNSWGYTKITKLFNWIKISKEGKVLKLPGNYTAGNTEDVWLYRKTSGKPHSRYKKMIEQIIIEPRREHSRKPDIVRKNIKDLFGDEVNMLEMFARIYGNDSKHGPTLYTEGWTFIGDAIDDKDIRESLKLLM